MTIGDKILNMRKARGWSQEDLADKIGVTRQAVSRWESNSAKPDADKIVDICDLFGVSADYLLRDQYDGAAAAPSVQPQRRTALGEALMKLTLAQWIWGIVLATGLVGVMILGISYGYIDASWNGVKTFEIYLIRYNLNWLWNLLWIMVICSFWCLFGRRLVTWIKGKITKSKG